MPLAFRWQILGSRIIPSSLLYLTLKMWLCGDGFFLFCPFREGTLRDPLLDLIPRQFPSSCVGRTVAQSLLATAFAEAEGASNANQSRTADCRRASQVSCSPHDASGEK